MRLYPKRLNSLVTPNSQRYWLGAPLIALRNFWPNAARYLNVPSILLKLFGFQIAKLMPRSCWL
jgi:hypothetical protein